MNVVLKQDFMIGSHLKKRGSVLTVTKDYGNDLIRKGVARDENFIEKIITKKKKK